MGKLAFILEGGLEYVCFFLFYFFILNLYRKMIKQNWQKKERLLEIIGYIQNIKMKSLNFFFFFLFKKIKLNRMSKTIVFSEDSLISEISFKSIFEFIGGTIEVVFEKNKNSHEVKYMKRANSKELNKF